MRLTSALALCLLPLPALAEVPQDPPNVPEFRPAFPDQTRAPERLSGIRLVVEELAGELENPWGIAVLPDGGGYLVTERPGRLRHIAADGTVSAPLEGVPEVWAEGQGGLLDIALGPDFAADRSLFLTYARPVGGGLSATAAARAVLRPDLTGLDGLTEIFVQDPPAEAAMHYGSRITPLDGALFVTTGDRGYDAPLAQDPAAPYGKVLRLSADGQAAPGNPVADSPVWSLGHRNLQGDAVAPDGSYWTVEHGPRGGDELNRPQAGANHGWPVISYGENYNGRPIGEALTEAPGMEQPVYYWDPVIAPGDMVFYDGALFPAWQGNLLIGSLNPGGLVRLEMANGRVTGEERLLPDLGRVRDVEVDADGSLLVITDYGDGSLLRIRPQG